MEENTVNIREANKDDIAFIKACLIDSWVEHAKQVSDLLDEDRMRNSKVEEYYTKALDSTESFIFIAEVDGKPVGLLKADIQTLPDFFTHNKILFLDDTYVVKEFRRKGIAKKLTCKIEDTAKHLGIKRIQSRIYTFNKPMQNLRESMGYTMPFSTWDKILD